MMNICEIQNCPKTAKARNLCGTHYSQLRRTGNPLGSLKIEDSIDPNGFIPKKPITSCSINECNNPHMSRGWCSTHYQRWLHHGDPQTVKTVGGPDDPCSKCGLNNRRKEHSWCQLCLNEAARIKNASERGPRWRRYKLTRSDVEKMKFSQSNSCPICGDSFDVVDDHVDHDNRCCGKEKTRNSGTCGKCVRELLCGSCNQGLGNFKDSPERLENAIKYLRKWE